MNYKSHITYKQHQSKQYHSKDQRAIMLDNEIFILTRNYLHDKICITSVEDFSSVR